MQAPGENLIIRLWDTLAEKGIGSLLRPWQIRREGKATLEVRKQEILALAQAETDAAAIRAGQRKLGPGGDLLTLSSDDSSRSSVSGAGGEEEKPKRLLLQTVSDSVVADALRKEVNVARAIHFAEDELRAGAQTTGQQPPTPTSSPDSDWLYRWRDAASEVSAQELQHLWGQVLAGEVKSPGQFSLRTLEFLRNITKQDAEAIELLSRYVFGTFMYSGDAKLLEAEGLNFAFLLSLQELGVISGVGGLGLNVNLGSLRSDVFQHGFVIGNRIILVSDPDPQKKIELPVYAVSRLGQEVCRLGSKQPSGLYMRSFGAAIANKGFDVSMAAGFPLPDGQFQYFSPEKIEPVAPPA